MKMTPAEKDRVRLALEEALANIDNIQVAFIMFNFQSTWAMSPFEMLGWLKYMSEMVKLDLLVQTAPKKSTIATPKTVQ